MISKNLWVIILTIIIEFTNIFPQNESSALTGFWESVLVKDNYAEMIRFFPDKKYEIVSVAASDYSYRLEHDTLITVLKTGDENKKEITDTSIIKIHGDTLFNFYKIKNNLYRTVLIKEKDVKDSNDGIAGSYYWNYPGGLIALSRFTGSGNLIFRLPRLWTTGSYTTRKNTLILHSKYLGDQKKYFWVKKKMLIIKDAAGRSESLYRKVDYFVKK